MIAVTSVRPDIPDPGGAHGVVSRGGALRRRRLLTVAGLLGLLAVVMLASLAVGAKSIPIAAVWDAL
ncbi:MAG: hypothetical protein ACRDSL_02140 [Pseudonocardiaceae bacterium]